MKCKRERPSGRPDKNFKCRGCGIRFYVIGATLASNERCCSPTCLDKVGPWQPMHGPQPRPSGWISKQIRLAYEGVKRKGSHRKKKGALAKYYNDPFFGSEEWLNLRYKALTTYGATCMLCKATRGAMHVDHIKPRSTHPHLQYDFDNLQVLCRDCSLGRSSTDVSDFRPKAEDLVAARTLKPILRKA